MDHLQIEERVKVVAEMLELTDSLHKKASGLTADGKQKISLGRGLVRPDVNVMMFDEPLTVIDPHLKWELRSQMKQLHRRFDFTMIYVTHDQTEALTFADQVVVMYEGEIVQVGTPNDLFEKPKHTFVGHFIGSPGMNLLPCELIEGSPVFDGNKVSVFMEVKGLGDFLPEYAGNLDIMTAAALRTAEMFAEEAYDQTITLPARG